MINGIVTGSVAALSLLTLGSSFSLFSAERNRKNILIGFACSALLLPLLHQTSSLTAPQIQRTLFSMYLVTITVFMLIVKETSQPFQSVKETISRYRASNRQWLAALVGPQYSILTMLLATMLFFLLFGVFESYYQMRGIGFTTSDTAMVVIFSVIAIVYITNRSSRLRVFFDVIFSAICIAYILSFFIVLMLSDISPILFFVMATGIVIMHVPVWNFLTETSVEWSLPPVFLYGITTAALFLSQILGRVIGWLIIVQFGSEYVYISKISAIALAVIAVVASLLLVSNMKKKREALEDQVPTTLGVDQKVEHIGAFCREYGLSERECDIISMYSQGRSVPFISSKCFISESTVRTYIGRVYVKLGIHSKQELLDKIDGAAKEGQHL
ncbi:MAG: helix-turn-helix transcriptional regulator [Coriobacteriia bacterium]